MNGPDIHDAIVQDAKPFSIIWLLPVIALAIGGWLLMKSIIEAPTQITIKFPTGVGMDVGKTKVMYEGVPVGVVSDIRLDKSDLKGILATVDMDRELDSMLRESTQFWLVKPEISLKGVTGLETIVTGNYIAMKMGLKGKKTKFYQALKEPPALDDAMNGMNLILHARDLGGIHKGAPVLYKDLIVGSVISYVLEANQNRVSVRIQIKPDYVHLIKHNSRFWNISGFQAKASLSGIEVGSTSLMSLLQGGITFDSPENAEGSPEVKSGQVFRLYESYEQAERGVAITLTFDTGTKLIEGGTTVRYKGFDVGKVKKLQLNEDHSQLNAVVMMQPDMAPLLRSGTRFWLMKPEISLQGVSGLDTVLSGNYIEMEAGEGMPETEFRGLSSPPKVDYSKPGLHIRLETDELNGIQRGSPITYKKVPVGMIEAITLSKKGSSVFVDAYIEPQYEKLVSRNTRFWNASGVSFSGSLSRVTFRAESLMSIIQGGVAFSTPKKEAIEKTQFNKNHRTIKNGRVFTLYDNVDAAMESGAPIRIRLKSSSGVEEGTLIKYQGFPIGEVRKIELLPDLQGVKVHAVLTQHAERFAVSGSKIWLVRPELSLSGASNLDTLLKGQYFEMEPGNGKPAYEFEGSLEQPASAFQQPGLNIVLKTPRLHSIGRGVNVLYRDIVVGKVTGYRMGEYADEVLIHVNIHEPYDRLIREGTRFWNTSGVDIDVGLFRGASIKTESLQTILIGGISFATPDNGRDLPRVEDGKTFVLHRDAQRDWLKWKPRIFLQ